MLIQPRRVNGFRDRLLGGKDKTPIGFIGSEQELYPQTASIQPPDD